MRSARHETDCQLQLADRDVRNRKSPAVVFFAFAPIGGRKIGEKSWSTARRYAKDEYFFIVPIRLNATTRLHDGLGLAVSLDIPCKLH